MNRFRSKFLFGTLLLLVWMLGYRYSPAISFYSRGVLHYFAGGFSEFKPLFGIFWLFLCSFVLTPRSTSTANSSAILPLLSLAGAYLLCLIGHVIFVLGFELHPLGYAVTATEREISSNQLLHIHVMKGGLFLLLQSLGLESVQFTSDPGRFFAETLPSALFVLHGLLMLHASVGILWLLRIKYEQWHAAGCGYLVVPYAITSSAAIRCAVDGGPLDWTTMSLTPIFLLVLKAERLPSRAQLLSALAVVTVGTGILLYLHSAAGSPAPLLVGLNSLLSLLFVLVATLGAAAITQSSTPVRRWLSFSAGVLTLATLSQNTFWAWDLRAWIRTFPAQSELLLVDYYERWPYPVRSHEGRLVLRTLTLSASETGAELYSRLGIRHNFTQIQPLNVNCNEHDSYTRQGRVLILEGALTSRNFSQPILKKFELVPCAPRELCSYRYHATLPGCLPDTLGEIVVNRFFELGATKIILMPESAGEQ